eukprot:CAMPEP_0178941122 /NCGR_PEP_ID=MMETSP0789-20121207/1213_1 /TAXON_ID=3005 /ORGANISM="Rhizosolenia setigera, Strain CCMP 1694" /LENGTH=256 /DNA_ID=CAMNT_0020620285 /DNA_START=178 /DNA_END=948 /DNA_ORIENTATION=-
MPVSKRSKPIALTQTAKKTREHKSGFIEQVRDEIDQHKYLFVFSFENMRSNKFKTIRMHFRDNNDDDNKNNNIGDEEMDTTMEKNKSSSSGSSRIFLGKNKLLQIAMGRTPEEEHADNLRHVSKLVNGSVGLLCTSRSKESVIEYFSNFSEQDFARAGSVAPKKVILTTEQVEIHPVSMIDHFRKLGLPLEIQNGKLKMMETSSINKHGGYLICNEGDTLSVEACKLLVHFGIQLSEFRVQLVCLWERDSSSFEML